MFLYPKKNYNFPQKKLKIQIPGCPSEATMIKYSAQHRTKVKTGPDPNIIISQQMNVLNTDNMRHLHISKQNLRCASIKTEIRAWRVFAKNFRQRVKNPASDRRNLNASH